MSVKSRRRALTILFVFSCMGGYIACSSPPPYEGGGRHLDNEVVSGSSTAKDASVPKDTSLPDTSVKDTSPLGD